MITETRKRSNSWGHRLEMLYPDELTDNSCCSKGHPAYADVPARHHVKPEFVFCYEYITGKAGRVTTRETYLCREHAEATANRYGLTLPSTLPSRKAAGS